MNLNLKYFILFALLNFVVLKVVFSEPNLYSCNHTINPNYCKIDTVYILDDQLILISGKKQNRFDNIIIDASSISTSIKLDTNNKDHFIIIYEFNASYMKRNLIIDLRWDGDSLRIIKEYYILYNSKIKNGYDFGWAILNNGEVFQGIEEKELVSYKIQTEKKCNVGISIFSGKENIEINICENEKSISIPVFYKNGQLLGFYSYYEETLPSLFLNFDGTEKLEFKTDIDFFDDLNSMNNSAYYLEQGGNYYEAVLLLQKVIEKDPNRIVAYINLGDAYWGMEEKTKAKEAYIKYIDLMKKSGKEAKIPKRIIERTNG